MSSSAIASAATVADLAALLRTLRRRQARRTGEPVLSYRRLAARSGWSHSSIAQYFSGQVLPPPDRFDVLTRLLGAAPVELRELATAYDRVADRRAPAAEARSAAPPPADGEPVRPRVAPAQLPMDVADFVGRVAELAELDRLAAGLRPSEQPGAAPAEAGTPVIVAIVGTAGVGKTSLAVRFAHRVRAWFPDGQLYVDLRGYHPERPMVPAEALAGFLRALGLPPGEVATAEAERAAQYRTELAGRRVLVVLDNAATADQVRPLLPGASSCLVLVTSRDTQAGLVARNGVRRIGLEVLPPADGLTLLRRLLGEQVERDLAAAELLLDQCARLPLAVRIAAEVAAAHPAAGLAGLVADLGDEQRRLARLTAGDDRDTAVEAVFSWSYRACPAPARTVFRLLGLHPGRDFDDHTVAALAGLDVDDAGRVLGTLVRAHMVQTREIAPGGGAIRYGMHDLLRAYATGLTGTQSTDEDHDAARGRLYEYYVQAAGQAVATLYPSDLDRRPADPPIPVALPPLDEPSAALRWLDTERTNLTAAVDDAAAHHRDEHAVRLATVLFRYLDGGHIRDALTVHDRAVRAARRLGDPVAEARAMGDLGAAHWQNNDWTRAAEHFQRALTLQLGLPDPAGAARMVSSLGVTYWRRGELELAAEHCGRAAEDYQRLGDRHGEARSLMNLGVVRLGQNQLDLAAELLTRAMAIHHAISCRDGEAYALTNLGRIFQRRGRLDRASDYHRRALELFQRVGDGNGEVITLNHMGIVERERGRFVEAAAHHNRALRRSQRNGNPHYQAQSLTNLGVLASRRDNHGEAVEQHQRALELFRRVGDRTGETESLNGLADALSALGRPAQARIRYRDALLLAQLTGDAHEEARARAGLAASPATGS